MCFNPLCPPSEPDALSLDLPKSIFKSSKTIIKLLMWIFSFFSQYTTALPLKFMKVFGFNNIICFPAYFDFKTSPYFAELNVPFKIIPS